MTVSRARRTPAPKGTPAGVGPVKGDRIRPPASTIKVLVIAPFIGQRVAPVLMTGQSGDDLAAVVELVEAAR